MDMEHSFEQQHSTITPDELETLSAQEGNESLGAVWHNFMSHAESYVSCVQQLQEAALGGDEDAFARLREEQAQLHTQLEEVYAVLEAELEQKGRSIEPHMSRMELAKFALLLLTSGAARMCKKAA